MPTNDNDPVTPRALPQGGDPHGMAALLLVESLIHGLCENATLSVGDAVAIAQRAIDVQFDHAEAAEAGRETGQGPAGAPMWRSHTLLTSIATSLRIDEKSAPSPSPTV